MNGQFLQLDLASVSCGKVRVEYADFPEFYEYFFDTTGFEKDTLKVEAVGKKMMGGSATDKEIYDFIRDVCVWGGGMRVYGNLSRHNGGLKSAIKKVAATVREVMKLLHQNKLEEAIAILITSGGKVKGFGVAYASKTLRMLSPEKAATFDSHLQTITGRKLTPADYAVWCHECGKVAAKIRAKNPKRKSGKWYVADVEAIIFNEVREHNRNKARKKTKK